MKNIIFILFFLSLSLCLQAEGYQVNLLSAKQSGMGHVGTAMKLGAESMHFNPAGLAWIEKSAELSMGCGFISTSIKYRNGDLSVHSDNKISTPIYGYAGFKIYDFLSAGIALTTPYGSSIKWGENWVGSTLVQQISLKSYCLQPSFSLKINSKWCVGVGFMFDWGNVNLHKGLISGSQLATQIPSWDANITPVSVHLEGSARVKMGINVGILWDASDKITIGASYRSKVTMKVKSGNASLIYANNNLRNILEQMENSTGIDLLPNIDNAEFIAELPLPANYSVGVCFKPDRRWTVSFDFQFTEWAAYKHLSVVFPYVEYNGQKPYVSQTLKKYKNSYALRMGAQYAFNQRFDVRAGLYFDQTPVNSHYYNPETPGMGKFGFSSGFSFCPFSLFSIDMSLLYIQGISRDGSLETSTDIYFKGDYSSHAWCPSIGLSYNF